MRLNGRKPFFSYFLILLIISSCVFSFIPTLVATTIFSDGFESGNLSAWTGTNTNGGGSVAASSEYAYESIYSGKAIVGSDGDWAVVYRSISPAGVMYMRGYVYVSAVGSTDGVRPFAESVYDWNPVARAGIRRASGVYYWSLSYGNGGGTESWNNSAITLSTGQWYMYQLAAYCDASVGWTKLWINNDLVLFNSNVNTGSAINIVDVGLADYAGTVYHDTILVSDSYIETTLYYPYIQQTSNIDGTASIGTYGNFSAQQKYDSIYDTLTEADTESGTSILGDNSGSGSSYRTTAANEMRLGVYTASATGEVQSIVFYGRGDASSQNCKAILCNSSGYILSNGVGSAVSVSTTAGTKTLTFADPKPVVTAGQSYWVGLITAGAVRVYYDSTTGGTSKQDTSNSYTTPTNPTDAGSTTETWRLMYANVNNVNYQLQLEEQFSNITDTGDTAEVCVATGSFSGEALSVQVWNGSWNTVGSLSASQWNNFTATSFINGSNLYIRFLAGTESDDVVQSTWQIDAAYLWIYNSTSGETYVFVLSESASISANLDIAKSLQRVNTESLVTSSALASSKQISKPLSELVVFSEVDVNSKDIFTYLPELLLAFDGLGSSKALQKINLESILFGSDAATSKGINTFLFASIDFSDATVFSRGVFAYLYESLFCSDAASIQKDMFSLLLEQLDIFAADTIQKALTDVLSVSVSVSSALLDQKGMFDIFNEVIAVSSAQASQKGMLDTFSEVTLISASAASQKSLTDIFSESIIVSSLFASQKGIFDVFSEAIAVTQVFASQKSLSDIFSESVAVSGLLLTSKSIFTAISEVLSASLSVSDSLTVIKGLLRYFSETMAASASLFNLKAMQDVFSETVALTASLDVSKTLTQIISEVLSGTVGVDAGLFVIKGLARIFSEVAAVGDVLSHQISIVILALEVVAAETCNILADLNWSISIHAAFVELMGTIMISSWLNPHFPLGLVSFTDAVAYALIGFLIALLICLAVFIFIKYPRSDDE